MTTGGSDAVCWICAPALGDLPPDYGVEEHPPPLLPLAGPGCVGWTVGGLENVEISSPQRRRPGRKPGHLEFQLETWTRCCQVPGFNLDEQSWAPQ